MTQTETQTGDYAVAEHALVEARRNGLGVDELVTMIREMAAGDEWAGSPSAPGARPGEEGGAA